ncbi:MAG TPA: glycosyltransferase family 2 protein [Terriglobales bacterium]|jgi:cellulose synthase/poly-beta-1,6-N-acetylglucosamine synthase-like glycosyltransferase|nr:glycosyltransferase family 2 protein [Terriglobales bacterium]
MLAKIIFFGAALTLFYVYVGYPVLLSLLALLHRRVRPQPGYTPNISILIAACNEEANIHQKLKQTLALDYPAEKMEVLVLSDGSEDRTDEIVQQFGDSRVRLIRIPQRQGKTNAQNHGVRYAQGEVLVFSDATTVYHPQALRYLTANYEDEKVGAVSGRYQYFDSEQASPTGLGTIVFWNYENNIKVQQSRISTLTGCCGCIYSVRKSSYTELASDVISDLVQPLWVIRKGYRVVFEDRALAYEQTTESTSEEFFMRVRVITRGMRGLLSVPDLLKPWKYGWIAFQLFSHKILRWLVPVFLLMLLGSNVALRHEHYFRFLLLAQAFFYLFAVMQTIVPLHRRWKLLGVPLYFCTLNAAALFSTIELLRGRKYVVWQPVRK